MATSAPSTPWSARPGRSRSPRPAASASTRRARWSSRPSSSRHRTARSSAPSRNRSSRGGPASSPAPPHGGEIEAGTAEQAERLAEGLGGTAWVCRGTWDGWEAFDRWHITANDLHPGSFPALGRIANRGFDRAVSFHAWLRSGVGVGGAAPKRLQETVRDAIGAAVGDDVPVFLVDDPAYRGDRPENVVNWLTADGTSGIQLEQGGIARAKYGDAIVDAVADALDGRLG